MRYRARWSATLLVAGLVAPPLCGQGSGGVADSAIPPRVGVTHDMLLHAATSGDWLMYGHNYWNNRFSPLKAINTTNARRLIPRAVYTHGAARLGSFETTPIVVGGTMGQLNPIWDKPRVQLSSDLDNELCQLVPQSVRPELRHCVRRAHGGFLFYLISWPYQFHDGVGHQRDQLDRQLR